jgi:hypothetical protein
VSVEAGSVIVGYADFPLSVLFLAAIGYLLCAGSEGDDSMRLSALCCAFLPWMKREGVILWFVVVVCAALLIWRARKSPRLLLLFLPGLMITVAWGFYLHHVHVVTSSDFLPMNLNTLGANLSRVGPIIATFVSEFGDIRAWGIFWLIAALGLCGAIRQFRDVRAVILVLAIALPLGIYGFAYVFSAWPDYHRHVGLSICRLLVHVTPVSCLTLPVALSALPSWREAFASSPRSTPSATCVEEFPGRTRGIDFA